MGRGRNIMSRKRLVEALETIDSPFTSIDISTKAGITARQAVRFLREIPYVEKVPIKRKRVRVIYRIKETNNKPLI